MEVSRIDHINIRIPKEGVESALNFYRDVLGFETEKLEEYERGDRTSFFLRLGDTAIINVRPKESFIEPDGKSFDHFCIVVNEDIEEIKRRLKEGGIEILRESEPLGSKGRAPAVYINDPFGYKLELKSSRDLA